MALSGCATASRMTNLAYQPTSGGIPVSATRNSVSGTARPGCVSPRPAKSLIYLPGRVLATAVTTANAPMFITE